MSPPPWHPRTLNAMRYLLSSVTVVIPDFFGFQTLSFTVLIFFNMFSTSKITFIFENFHFTFHIINSMVYVLLSFCSFISSFELIIFRSTASFGSITSTFTGNIHAVLISCSNVLLFSTECIFRPFPFQDHLCFGSPVLFIITP